MTTHARFVFVLSLLMSTAMSAPAVFAQPAPAVANRDRARELALEGINAFNRNDFATVIERFEAAEQAFHAPVHLRFLAIAYERITPSRLVDARSTWALLAAEQLAGDAPQPFRDAVAEAARELPRVTALLGRLRFEVTNGGPGMAIEVDGRGLHIEGLNEAQFVAPGEHIITARRAGFVDVQRTVRVGAGGLETVPVRFDPPPTLSAVPRGPSESTVGPMTRTVSHSNPVRTIGIALAGVGGAALIGGVITGVMASSAFSDLETRCPNGVCRNAADLSLRDDVDTLSAMTNGLLIGGGVLAVSGIVMIIVGRPRTETVQVSVGPRGGSLTIPF